MTAFIAFINSVPQLVKLATIFVEKWQETQLSKIDAIYSEKDKQRLAIIKALKKADSDEERKVLARMLYNLNYNNTSSTK